MDIRDAVALATELLIVGLFAGTLVTALRRQDPFARDVTFIFAPLAVLVVVDMGRRVLGPIPTVVGYALILLLFAQPLFVLRLVARLRDLPRWLLPGAALVTAVGIIAIASTALGVPTGVAIVGVPGFVGLQVIAAAYLGLESRRRRGTSRVRMALAALATGGFAIGFLGSGLGSAVAAAAGVGQVLILLSTLGYIIAFLPPRPLRRLWQATPALDYSERLLAAPSGETEQQLWTRYVEAAKAISGSEAVLVDGSEGHVDLVLAATLAAMPIGSRYRGPAGPVGGTGFAHEIAVPIVSRRPATLVLLSNHASLFSVDDTALLGALGAQTALLVERRAVLAEQQALTAQLSRTVEALSSANAAKSDFLASMSHELRTPLNAVIGFSELMRDEPETDGSKAVPAEWIEHVHRSGQHLLALINDVLDLAKVDAGRLEFVPESIELGQAIGETVAGLRPLADRKAISLEMAVQHAVVELDRGRLRQVLYNLLSNAIKYTPDGGRVTVEASADASMTRLSVADTGVGIAPEDQARVFEEFTQVGDATQRQAGTGLGLALTRRLVEAQGGRIRLESTLGEGSRFVVELPAVSAATGISIIDASGGQEALHRLRNGGSTNGDILIIEDDPSAVRLLRTYLEGDGHRVRVCADAEAGLMAARDELPAAIVLDVLLPGMDGWDLLRILKDDPELRDVPAIIVTVVDERDVGLALGAVDYFLKPVSREALLRRLARHRFIAKVKHGPVHVLAIDDEPQTLDLVRAVLEPEGFTVTSALSGHAGLELALSQPVDLVICDLLMPDVDGFAVVAGLKASDTTREIPIMILTAHEVSAAEKARLNGQILGIVQKGDYAVSGLRAWLADVGTEGGLSDTLRIA